MFQPHNLERLEMKQEHVFILHATRTDLKHNFMEVFTSIEQLEGFLFNHPKVVKVQITWHEVNPD